LFKALGFLGIKEWLLGRILGLVGEFSSSVLAKSL